MKKLYLLLLLLAQALQHMAQPNMVPNCSFEDISACPNSYSQIGLANGWYQYTGGSPDYFNACAVNTNVWVPANDFGDILAAHGNAYAGFSSSTGYREMIARVITPLQQGKQYEVSLSVTLGGHCNNTTNALGVHFSRLAPASYPSVTGDPAVTPQVNYQSYGYITNNTSWLRVTKVLTADSAYERMAIGCFGATIASTPVIPLLMPTRNCYFFVDSIVVKLFRGIKIGTPANLILCRGDVVQVPFTVTNENNYYQPGNSFQLQLSDASGSFAAPVNIGTQAGIVGGTITGTLPVSLTAGTGYRLRITSTATADTSDASVYNLSISTVIPVKPVATGNTPVCTNEILNLAATTTTPGVSWGWTGPNSFTSTAQNPVINPVTTVMSGDYIVQATLAGCKSERDTVAVTVQQAPNITTAGSNTPVCSGQPINLTGSNATPGVTWGWTGPNSYASAAQNPVISNSTIAMGGDYIVSATLNGCSMLDTVTVAIKPTPVATAGSNSPLCAGAALSLTAFSNDPSVIFTWTGPLGFTASTGSAGIASTTTAMSGNYIATATLNGCSSTYSVPVAINPMPAIPVAGSNSPACDVLTLTATSTTGAAYSWAGPLSFASTQQNPVINPATPANNGTYSVTARLGNCVSQAANIAVVVNPQPYLGAYASPNDTVCAGTVVTFVTVPMNGIVNPVFQWFKNGAEIAGQNGLTYIGPYTTGDSIYCRTFAQDLCGNNITLFSNKVGMTILPLVNTLSAAIASTPAQPLPGQPVQFQATPVSGGYAPLYQWRRNGQDVSGAVNANWSTNNLAPYDQVSCKVTSSDPCASPKETVSNTITVNFPTYINDVNDNAGISIYPNPTQGAIGISSKTAISNISVLNAAGQLVYQLSVDSKHELQVSLPATLPNGLYLLKLETATGIMQQRITLQR